MLVDFRLSRDTAAGVGVVDTLHGLADISRPDMAAVIWRRQPAQQFQDWIDDLDADVLPSARIVIAAHAVRSNVEKIVDRSGATTSNAAQWLIDDIVALAECFTELMQSPCLRLRLDVVTTNACRKFHIDAVKARLICTYRGTGTQYGTSTGGADPDRVFTVPTGAPMLLRGTDWPEAPASGLRHRSPPIEGTSETRLVLVMDPVFDPDEDL
ncbi:MAG: DUF1826 domain-containing protein [Pseudomonadota bacterium]